MVAVRLSETAYSQMQAMARAQGGSDSETHRALLKEAVVARMALCRARHHGPIRDGACGHCGQGA